MRVLGVDLAHGTTGLVLLPSGWLSAGAPDWSIVEHRLLDCTDAKGFSPVDRRACVVGRLLSIAAQFKPDLIRVEESFAMRNAAASMLAKLHGELERRCYLERIDLAKVTRPQAYKLAVGKGNAHKQHLQQMLRAAGAPFWECSDRCDAWAVANFALSELGAHHLGVAA